MARLLVWCRFLAVGQILLGTCAIAQTPKARNVLFIGVDDMRVELNCYGQDWIVSPNIDRLAERGTKFTRAYCQQAVCNPSRASMLTGLRPNTLGIWDLPTHFRQRVPDVVTLPQLFKSQGYFAQDIGKIFHNWRQDDYQGDPASWSVPAVLHYNTHGADKAQVEGELPPDLETTPKCESRDVPDEAYFDGRVAAQAVEALQQLASANRPWFLAVGFWKPHAHFNAPKKYWDLYEREAIPTPVPLGFPVNAPELAAHDGREILRDFDRKPPTPVQAKTLRHGYYAAISYVDAQIGKVVSELERLGLADETIIVLFSDHGYHLGEHGLWAKTSNFELDARVPLIICTPEHRGGRTSDSLVELLDLYPTLVDLCGLPTRGELEGKSLKPILENPQAIVKPAALTWHPRPAYPKAGDEPEAMGYSMRTPRYRYTEWRDFATGEVLARELYDHDEDPLETQNVAAETSRSPVVQELASMLAKQYQW